LGSNFSGTSTTFVADILTPARRIYPSRIGTPLPSGYAIIANLPVCGYKFPATLIGAGYSLFSH
jgi:hypothetical protein